MPETVDEVIAIAQAQKQIVSARQLKRWHVDGLIPSPEIQRLGRGKGTRARYPDGTGNLVALICAETDRGLSQVAWKLWWAGQPIPLKSVRAFLEEKLDSWGRAMAQSIDLERGGLREEVIDGLDARVEMQRTIPGSLRAKQKIGADRFSNMLINIFMMATATIELGKMSPDEHEDFEAVFRPYGDWEKNLFGDVSVDYPGLVEFLSNVNKVDLSDAEMLEARRETRNFVELCQDLTPFLSLEMAEQWEGVIPNGTDQEVMIFAAIAKLRSRPETKSLLESLSEVLEPMRKFCRMLELLRTQVPAVASELAPNKLRVIGRGKAAITKNSNLLKVVCEAHREDLNTFFEDHAEFIESTDKQ